MIGYIAWLLRDEAIGERAALAGEAPALATWRTCAPDACRPPGLPDCKFMCLPATTMSRIRRWTAGV